jgi:uracil phosphoribosyltransferase
MAATGASTAEVIRLYKEEVPGDPRQIVVVHLIVTPEYVKRITSEFPDVQIYAIRIDRGLSAAQVLEKVPGEDWSSEKGLNNHQYIVPGGGGFGEVINNAWV